MLLAGGAGLRWFGDRTAPDALARDHGISRVTAYRYLDEVVAALAAQAPELGETSKRSPPRRGIHAHPHAIGTATGTVEGIARNRSAVVGGRRA